jgi:hypothetical protein
LCKKIHKIVSISLHFQNNYFNAISASHRLDDIRDHVNILGQRLERTKESNQVSLLIYVVANLCV